jgi:hypothetical protein
MVPANGGAFSGAYSGGYSLTLCVSGYRGHEGSFTFKGSGNASFLHGSTESGVMKRGKINQNLCVGWGGTATLSSSRNPQNQIVMDIFSHSATIDSPCGHVFYYSVTGGSGKFANASGSGTVSFTCSGSTSYTDRWSGTLNY